MQMKTNITLLALAILGMVTIMSCTKTVSGTPPSMAASIGSTSYKSPYCMAAQTGSKMEILGLNGTTTTPTYPYVYLYIPKWTGLPTTYPIDSTGVNFGYYFSSSSSALYAVKGSINILSVSSDLVTGTFLFSCNDGTAVSNGIFSARLVVNP